MYKAALPALSVAAISPPPNYCQSVNILASYWFISQLASILLRYWSPVSPAEFNCLRVATAIFSHAFSPPDSLSFSSSLSTLSSASPFSFSFFSSHFLSYSAGRHSICLINSLM